LNITAIENYYKEEMLNHSAAGAAYTYGVKATDYGMKELRADVLSNNPYNRSLSELELILADIESYQPQNLKNYREEHRPFAIDPSEIDQATVSYYGLSENKLFN